MPLGLPQGIVTFTLGRRSIYHWRKARWHASNAAGFTPGDHCFRAKFRPTLILEHESRWARTEGWKYVPGTQGPGTQGPYGFSMWLAGAGVQGGIAYGATDEFGFAAVENRVHVHDLHATILHLMGIDHTLLTYFHQGRNERLTDVYGNVIQGILA
jgi:Protein of unknown function (DUF1501)